MLQGSVQSHTPGPRQNAASRRGQRRPNDNQFLCQKFIKCLEFYDAESMGDGVQRFTRDIEVSEGGRQACTPCRHMDGADEGHLGIECHRRLSNTSERGSPTTSKALRKCILRRAGSSSKRRGRNPVAKRGHIFVPAKHRGFLLHNISGPQEEWSDETCDQFKEPQSMGGGPSLQNGGDCYSEGPSEIRGLDGKGGSEGPNSSLTSTVTEVHHEGDVLPIHLSPFRPLLCPMDFHQGNETSNDTAEVMGSQDNSLHRRHVCSGRDKGGGESTPGSVAVPPGSPRVYCQSREVIPGPNTGTGIPWVARGLA